MIPRVLFLDIDGVLNCSRCIQLSDDMLHTGHVRQLERIVDATRCEVVISSTWRLIHTIPNLLMQLRHRGYSHGILSTTPHKSYGIRGDEIKAWLACHPTERFAIVDDNDDMGDLLPQLVKTSFDRGLRATEADRLIEMLGGVR